MLEKAVVFLLDRDDQHRVDQIDERLFHLDLMLELLGNHFSWVFLIQTCVFFLAVAKNVKEILLFDKTD